MFDRTSRQKTSNIVNLNTINQLGLFNTLHILLKCTQSVHQDRPQSGLTHKTSLNEFKRIQDRHCMLSDHNGIQLEITH